MQHGRRWRYQRKNDFAVNGTARGRRRTTKGQDDRGRLMAHYRPFRLRLPVEGGDGTSREAAIRALTDKSLLWTCCHSQETDGREQSYSLRSGFSGASMLANDLRNSIGTGNRIVEFFSAAISVRVCR